MSSADRDPALVRPVTLADAAAIAQLEGSTFTLFSYGPEGIRELVEGHPQLGVVAYREQRFLGYALGSVWETPQIAPATAWLNSLAVTPQARGGGIGACLLDAAMEAARQDQHTAMMLYVRPHNQVARALYCSRGFVETQDPQPDPDSDRLTLRAVL